eukprot:11811788-Alexandrium_andersonii.AAC.1
MQVRASEQASLRSLRESRRCSVAESGEDQTRSVAPSRTAPEEAPSGREDARVAALLSELVEAQSK